MTGMNLERSRTYTLLDSLDLQKSEIIDYFWPMYTETVYYLRYSLSQYCLLLLINFFDLGVITGRRNMKAMIFFFQKHILFQGTLLHDIVVVDLPGKRLRFAISYLIGSLRYNLRVRLTLYTRELLPIMTLVQLFNIAFWLEREIWDMYGILIMDHPDMRRLLTDYNFHGFPGRKDFPLTGFFEIHYSDIKKCIIQKRVSLAQAYRYYEFRNPWINLR